MGKEERSFTQVLQCNHVLKVDSGDSRVFLRCCHVLRFTDLRHLSADKFGLLTIQIVVKDLVVLQLRPDDLKYHHSVYEDSSAEHCRDHIHEI